MSVTGALFPFEPRWFIEASTGCSCCSGENFTAGPYATKEDVDAAAQRYHNDRRLVSRYAPNGRYYVKVATCEVLPDGRVISEGMVWGPEVEERRS